MKNRDEKNDRSANDICSSHQMTEMAPNDNQNDLSERNTYADLVR